MFGIHLISLHGPRVGNVEEGAEPCNSAEFSSGTVATSSCSDVGQLGILNVGVRAVESRATNWNVEGRF